MKRTTYLLVSLLVLLSILLTSCSTPAQPTQAAGGPTTAARLKIRVATEAAYPPFEMVNEQTRDLEGFDIDLMKAVAEKANLDVDFVNTPFDSVLAGIATCQFDAAISAITITEDRAKESNFSTAYITAGQIISVRLDNTDINSPEDLQGKTVGVQLSTTGQIEVEKIAGATVRPYDTVDLAFQDLMNGQVDAVVADLAPSANYVNQSKDKIRFTGDVFTTEEYGIAICKTNTELLEKVNAALAELESDGTLKALEEKWLSLD
jgi:polar amino acid transport system substrate-binding protein